MSAHICLTGRLTRWEAWPAQASTAYQRPWPSRSQPAGTGPVPRFWPSLWANLLWRDNRQLRA